MQKKNKFSYKDLKINEEELSITKIGEMPSENKSPAFLLVVFGILIVFVFFLPNIVSFFNKDDELLNNNPVVNENNEEKNDEQKEDLIYYDLNSNLMINLEEGVKLDNFRIENDILLFNITNSNNTRFDFGKFNYFMEFYDNNQTLLERIILEKVSVAKDEISSASYPLANLTSRNAKKIVFVKKDENDYPSVDLSKNETGEDVLVCNKSTQSITYKFKDNKLSSISDVLNYEKGNTSDFTYQMDLSLWQSKVNNYNNITGVSSSFISNSNGFIVNTIVDLKNVNLSDINDENYYKYETLSKVVNFEMEARGFSCN